MVQNWHFKKLSICKANAQISEKIRLWVILPLFSMPAYKSNWNKYRLVREYLRYLTALNFNQSKVYEPDLRDRRFHRPDLAWYRVWACPKVCPFLVCKRKSSTGRLKSIQFSKGQHLYHEIYFTKYRRINLMTINYFIISQRFHQSIKKVS